MKVFVTGGSGYVGRAAIGRLVAQGHRVIALSRSAASAQAMRALGAEPCQGDLLSPPPSGLEGVQAVVHAAAPLVF